MRRVSESENGYRDGKKFKEKEAMDSTVRATNGPLGSPQMRRGGRKFQSADYLDLMTSNNNKTQSLRR